jgi:hypothetical protein
VRDLLEVALHLVLEIPHGVQDDKFPGVIEELHYFYFTVSFMTLEIYQTTIRSCINITNTLPPGEIKYYLLLLLNSLKNTHNELTTEFVMKLTDFINKLQIIMLNDPASDRYQELFNQLLVSYQAMISLSKVRSFPTKIGYSLLNLGGAVTGFSLGVLGGLTGGVAGFFRGVWNLENPIKAGIIGVFTGYMIGAAFGYRMPKKIFKDALTRQLKFCLDGFEACIDSLRPTRNADFSKRIEDVKNRIRRDQFNNDEEAFDAFLKHVEVEYEICSLRAQFISPSLEGFLGHHLLIKLTLNNEVTPMALEFAPSPSDLSLPPSQSEMRCASGGTIIQMIALHELLQETHACTPSYVLKRMKPGDRDCYSYVNKILKGTNQDATTLKRFDGSENWVGRNIIGFFTQKLSPFKQDILINPVEQLLPGNESLI